MLVQEFCRLSQPSHLAAYTRNPSLLCVMASVAHVRDVLRTPSILVPRAKEAEDGYYYHHGRYAPYGLYGSSDPADRSYLGTPLKQRCAFLQDPTNALAVAVKVGRR